VWDVRRIYVNGVLAHLTLFEIFIILFLLTILKCSRIIESLVILRPKSPLPSAYNISSALPRCTVRYHNIIYTVSVDISENIVCAWNNDIAHADDVCAQITMIIIIIIAAWYIWSCPYIECLLSSTPRVRKWRRGEGVVIECVCVCYI